MRGSKTATIPLSVFVLISHANNTAAKIILFMFGAKDLFKNFQHVQAFVLSKGSDRFFIRKDDAFIFSPLCSN